MSTKLVTWNMQGGGPGASKWTADVSRLFLQREAIIVCLQHCGSVPSDAKFQSDIAKDCPGAVFIWSAGISDKAKFEVAILWLQSPTGDLAILAPRRYVASGLVAKSGDSASWALGAQFSSNSNAKSTIYTSNAFLNPTTEPPLLLRHIATSSTPWLAIGSFNQEAMDWIWNPNIMPTGALYCGQSQAASMPGSVSSLDYGIYNSGTEPRHHMTGKPDMSFISSEHFPIFYELPIDLQT